MSQPYMLFFYMGHTERANFLQNLCFMFVCMYVLFYICVRIDSVDLT